MNTTSLCNVILCAFQGWPLRYKQWSILMIFNDVYRRPESMGQQPGVYNMKEKEVSEEKEEVPWRAMRKNSEMKVRYFLFINCYCIRSSQPFNLVYRNVHLNQSMATSGPRPAKHVNVTRIDILG